MLPIDLPDVVVHGTETGDATLTIRAGCAGRPASCPMCESANFVGHGQKQQEVMDLPHHGRYTCIHLARKRFLCRDCSQTFFYPLDWIDDDHRATRRFVDRIASLALERSFSDIAREYGISEHGVRGIFYGRHQDIIDTTQFQTPEFMGIDELNIAGTARGVITNLANNSAIEFLKDCSTKTFREYFERMPDRHLVKAVAMDCTRRYKVLINEMFPGAAVVADKFHVLKMADLAVDEIRKAVRKNIDSSRTQLRLKQDKFVLKTREHNLADWQREKLDGWRQSFPEIGVAYDTKEAYYRIYDAGSRQEAKLRFDIWRTSLPPTHGPYWKSILITWGYWENEILAFFDFPITNAYTECQNGLTRALSRMGHGSYGFDAIRINLLKAPKRQGMVAGYRNIKRQATKPEPRAWGLMSTFSSWKGDGGVIERVPVQKLVTFGVAIDQLETWLEEDLTGQGRLPGLD